MRKTVNIVEDICLKEYTTLKIGGNARYFVEPSSQDEIIDAISFAKKNKLPWYIIGNGSNLLFDDEGFNGLIIRISSKFSEITVKGCIITAQAGAWMPNIARKSQQYSLTGLEHTIGIPGNLGGVITMNGGSRRKRISDNLRKITVLNEDLSIIELDIDDCNFGYRKSIFQTKNYVILSAELELKAGNQHSIRKEMLQILKERRHKFPRKLPNCGSVFKSNPKLYDNFGTPGKIIEDLGMKGSCEGGVCISDMHANFFINRNNGTSKDFKSLLERTSNKILKKHGFMIEPEVLYVDSNKRI